MCESNANEPVPSPLLDGSNCRSALTREQQQFAEALGDSLAAAWLQEQTLLKSSARQLGPSQGLLDGPTLERSR
jgi:hypothetical protein